ncbi:MAG: tetratricopeptide repeat protein [Bacteroidales bacterium]
MKRITLILTLAFGANLIFAQTSKDINFDQYSKKIDKSNTEIQDSKKSLKAATWISRAELMLDVYDAQLLRAYIGMDPQTFMLIVGKPLAQTQEIIDNVAVDKYVMERVTFYFSDGKLDKWEVTKPLVDKTLGLALESLKKAIELDVDGKKTKKINEDLVKIKGLYVNEGSNFYALKDYKNAYLNFKDVIEIGQLPQLNHKDTAIYYYTALSAQLAGNFEEAIEFYKEAIKLNFTSEGAAYYNIYDAYRSLNKIDEGTPYLEEGFLKFPKNTNILFSLINNYINKGDDPSKIMVYMDKALSDDPNNSSLYFAKGTLYDKLNDPENAAKAYLKAIETDPKSFDAYYNLGAVYFNNGVKIVEEANKVPAKEVEKYDALMAKAGEEYKKALPYMEKAFSINPESKDVLEALKNIYFRFRNESDEMNNKFKEYNEKLKSM